MAANHGLIMSQIEEFLIGNLEAELVDCNRLIQQQADVVEWNVINNVSSRTVAGHIERLERLRSQSRLARRGFAEFNFSMFSLSWTAKSHMKFIFLEKLFEKARKKRL